MYKEYQQCDNCKKEYYITVDDKTHEYQNRSDCDCVKIDRKLPNIDNILPKIRNQLESKEWQLDHLPKIVGSLNNELIESILLPEKESKIKLSLIYLSTLKAMNPDLQTLDFVQFIHKAQIFGADPNRDQVYLVPYKTNVNGEWIKKSSVIFSYHFYISKAEEHKQFDGWDTDTQVGDYFNAATGKVEKQLYSEVKVYRKDRSRPIIYRAWYSEFVKKDKSGNINSQWQKPYVMLPKCALCNCLKQAFPEELSGMTTEYDKMDKEVDLAGIDNDNTIEATIAEPEKKPEVKTNTIETEKVEKPKDEKKPDQKEEKSQDTKEIKLISEAQIKRLMAIIINSPKGWSIEQVQDYLKLVFKIDSEKELNTNQYKWICEKIEKLTPAEFGHEWAKSVKEKQEEGKK